MTALSDDTKKRYLELARCDARENPGVVLSSNNISDSLDHLAKDDDEITQDNWDQLETYVVDQLFQEGLIYRSYNKEDYVRLVQDKGLISWTEKSMQDIVRRNRQYSSGLLPIFRDTEFPVDPDCRYIID